MKKNILLINRNRTSNLGDQKISETMKKLFDIENVNVNVAEYSEFLGKKIICQKSNKNNKSFLQNIKKNICSISCIKEFKWKIDNRSMFNILKNKNYDYIILGGGELIQSNSHFPIAFNTWIRKINKYQKNAKIILFSIGVTKEFTKRNYKLFNDGLKHVNKVYVRDKESFRNMKDIFKVESEIIPDVVFFNNYNNSLLKENLVLYGVTSYQRVCKYGLIAKSKDDYYKTILKDINRIQKDFPHYKIMIFYTSQEDFDSCKDFLNYIQKEEYIEIADTNTLENLHKFCRSAKYVFSPRMHGCIIGAMEGCKIFPIKISPKICTFEKAYLPNIEFKKLRNILVNKREEVINL